MRYKNNFFPAIGLSNIPAFVSFGFIKGKIDDTFYAQIKDNIALAIKKFSYATYAKFDFKKLIQFGFV